MASILQKLLKNQSSTRIFAALSKPRQPIFVAPLLPHHLANTKPSFEDSINPLPFLDLPKVEESNPSQFSHFYPNFPFGFYLNPIYSTGLVESEPVDVVPGDDPHRIWADSVKKKRKRKMNKHKLRKLRKRLRRKT